MVPPTLTAALFSLAFALATLPPGSGEEAAPESLKSRAVLMAAILGVLITLLLSLIALTIFRRMIAAGRRHDEPAPPGEPPVSAWKTAGARAQADPAPPAADDPNDQER